MNHKINKLNKNCLKMLIREYKADQENNLKFIKNQKVSNMKKSELVALVEKLFNDDSPNSIVIEKQNK